MTPDLTPFTKGQESVNKYVTQRISGVTNTETGTNIHTVLGVLIPIMHNGTINAKVVMYCANTETVNELNYVQLPEMEYDENDEENYWDESTGEYDYARLVDEKSMKVHEGSLESLIGVIGEHGKVEVTNVLYYENLPNMEFFTKYKKEKYKEYLILDQEV